LLRAGAGWSRGVFIVCNGHFKLYDGKGVSTPTPFDASLLVRDLCSMQGEGVWHGTTFMGESSSGMAFNLTTWLIEELVVCALGKVGEPVHFRVTLIGTTIIWIWLTEISDTDEITFVDANYELISEPVIDPDEWRKNGPRTERHPGQASEAIHYRLPSQWAAAQAHLLGRHHRIESGARGATRLCVHPSRLDGGCIPRAYPLRGHVLPQHEGGAWLLEQMG
jgi:hypothetical protein